MTISEQIARLLSIRETKKALNAQLEELNAEQESLEKGLIDRLDAEGSVSVSSTAGTAVITETELPQVEDWDAVEAYIYENQALHLLQRRIAAGAYRELLTAGTVIPGTQKIVKRSIGLTAKK